MNFRTALAVLGAAFILPTLGSAQIRSEVSTPVISNASTTPDVYQLTYFRNAQGAVPDTAIDVVDPGTNGLGNMCVNVYVFTPDEELAECCSCPITHNQVLEFSVNVNLTANPANGRTVHNGVIKIVASAEAPSCNAGAANLAPVATLRSWKTAFHAIPGTTTYTATEEEFSSAGLSAAELTQITGNCNNYQTELSGAGICTCPAALVD